MQSGVWSRRGRESRPLGKTRRFQLRGMKTYQCYYSLVLLFTVQLLHSLSCRFLCVYIHNVSFSSPELHNSTDSAGYDQQLGLS